MGTPSEGVAVQDTNAVLEATMHNLESILIDPLTNEVAVEIFIASV
jgi:hypothetical protein